MIQITDWDRLQHYKKPKPAWIKLYRDLLNDYHFQKLPIEDRWTLVGLYLLAAETDNATPLDPEWIKERLHLPTLPNLEVLQTLGFISLGEPSRQPLEKVYPKKRREEKKELSSEEQEVFDYWQERRKLALNLNGGPPMTPTDKRISKIRGRLKEGYAVEALKNAVDGCMTNKLNIEGGFVDIELICRDQQHVEQYLTWFRKNRAQQTYNPIGQY